MAISLGSIVVDLIAKTASFQAGMTEAAVTAKKAAKDIQEFVAEAQQLGLVISTQTAEGAHQFEQSLTKIQSALQGAANAVLTAMLPSMQALSNFIVSDLKDPSGIFRTMGSTILEIVVPSFKVLASAIATVVTIGDYFSAALTNGIQFATSLVYGLANAFSDLKTGHFSEAGNELKESFKQGLGAFTKGVQDETSAADKRLQTFFSKTWFGLDDSKQEKKKNPTGNVDVAPAQNKAVTDQLAKLQEAANAQLQLASATDFSTGAIRVQNEQNEISANLLQLSEKAHISLAAATKLWGDTVSKAIVTADEGKNLASLNEQITKSIQQLQQHTAETLNMANAMTAGGQAVVNAQEKIAAAPLLQLIDETQKSMDRAAQTLGVNSQQYQTLAASLQRAKEQLVAFQGAFDASKQADYTKDLASAYDGLRSKIEGLAIEGAAIGGSTEQLREASVAAQLAAFVAAHPGLDTGTTEWKQYADAVEQASQKVQDNADKTNALKYDLSTTFTQTIKQLEKYRTELEGLHKDTLAVDVAEQDAAKNVIKSYDDLLLKTTNLRNGMQAFFNQIALDAKTPAQQIFDVFNQTYTSMQDALTKLVLGQKNALQELGKSVEQTLAKTAVQNISQKAVSGLGNLFGFKLGSSAGLKRDGNLPNTALYVQMVNAAGNIIDSLGGKGNGGAAGSGSSGSDSSKSATSGLTNIFKDIGSKLSSTFSSVFGSIGKVLGSIGSSFGGIFGSIFGGFKADGGSVSAGKAYVVGEQRPELFVPRAAGTIIPNLSTSSSKQISVVNQLHVHGVTDADSFRKSQQQIFTGMTRAQQHAVSRS